MKKHEKNFFIVELTNEKESKSLCLKYEIDESHAAQKWFRLARTTTKFNHTVKGGGNFNKDFIEINYEPVNSVDLEREDYCSFSTDLNWGDLLVSYGMTGVPTLNAFYDKSTPTPQNIMTSGAHLSFYNDLSLSKNLYKDCEQWLREEHLIDIKDPKSSVGMMKVGSLVKDSNRIIIESLKKECTKVKSVRTEGDISQILNDPSVRNQVSIDGPASVIRIKGNYKIKIATFFLNQTQDYYDVTELSELITKASLYPYEVSIISESEVDGLMEQSHRDEFDFVLLLEAGTYIKDAESYMSGVYKAVDLMTSENIAGSVSLRDFSGLTLPGFANDFILLDLKTWDSRGRISLFNNEKTSNFAFPSYSRSKIGFFGNSIPYWIGPGSLEEIKTGKAILGTVFMASCIEAGYKFILRPSATRRSSTSMWASTGINEHYKKIKKDIKRDIGLLKRELEYFPKEKVRSYYMSNFEPDLVIVQSKLFNPFILLKQLGLKEGVCFHMLYNSQYSLQLSELFDDENSLNNIVKEISTRSFTNPGRKITISQTRQFLKGFLDDYELSEKEFMNMVSGLNVQSKLIVKQLSEQSDEVLSLIEAVNKTYLYVGDYFFNKSLLFEKTETQLKESFIVFVSSIAKKLNTNCYINKHKNISIIGKSVDDPFVVVSSCLTGQEEDQLWEIV